MNIFDPSDPLPVIDRLDDPFPTKQLTELLLNVPDIVNVFDPIANFPFVKFNAVPTSTSLPNVIVLPVRFTVRVPNLFVVPGVLWSK
jgi:hypothetical protein